MATLTFATLLVSMALSSTLSIGVRPEFTPQPTGVGTLSIFYTDSANLSEDDLAPQLYQNRRISIPPPDGALLSLTENW